MLMPTAFSVVALVLALVSFQVEIDPIEAGFTPIISNHPAPSGGVGISAEQHFQHQLTQSLDNNQDPLFGTQQNGDGIGNGANYQLDLTSSELNPSGQDLANGNNNHNQHDPSADYYYPDQSSINNINNNHNNNANNQGTFDTHLLLSNNRQRLPEKEYLSHDLAEKACRLDRGCQRKDRLNNTYLSYCTRYKLENLFSNEILMSIMHDSIEECDKILDEFIQLDELINQFDQYFKKLLMRYNCHNGYSVKWSCEDCKKAYKDWLCGTYLPYYMNGERIKPCISFCERVEQRCPYLHPIMKEQYGGQPVFICRDPNIPFVPEITPDIPYSEPAKCYDLCHLSDNKTELLIDSLSKYDHGKCPTKGSIAEEVRSDPLYCRLDNEQQQTAANRSKVNYDPEQFDPSTLNEYQTENHDQTTTTSTSAINFNGTLIDGERKASGGGTKIHVHIKKLEELREVLTVNDRSIDHGKHWSTPRSHHSPARARRQSHVEELNRSSGQHTDTAERCDRCFAQ